MRIFLVMVILCLTAGGVLAMAKLTNKSNNEVPRHLDF